MKSKDENNKKKYDLEERTAKFAEDIIDFLKSLPETPINKPLVIQLIKASSSIGANYNEADAAESKKDFKHKIGICRKEAKETRHFLRLIGRTNPERINECRNLWCEAQEFVLIFSAIFRH